MTSTTIPSSASIRTAISSAMLMVLAGCGGGSDSSPASAGPVTPPVSQQPPPPQPPSPPEPTYTIGGVVSGLEGTLQLVNNGGDTRTLTTNGAFTFATALTANASYAVTVEAAPLAQQCSVRNGSGAISANVSNIEVTCANLATWRAIDSPAQPGTGSAVFPQVAFDQAGNAIAVWTFHNHGGNSDVMASRYTPATGWDAPVLLEQSNEQVLESPLLAVADDGSAIAAWFQQGATAPGQTGSQKGLFVSRYDASAQTWSSPEAIAVSNFVSTLRLAFGRNGSGYVAWQQDAAGASGVVYTGWVNRYTPSAGWSGAELIDATPDGMENLEIAVSDNGVAFAAWRALDPAVGEERVWVARRTSGDWTAPEVIAGSGPVDQHRTIDVAVDAQGQSAVLAFTRYDGSAGRDHVHAASFSNGVWSEAEALQTDAPARAPYVAMRANGEAMVLWAQVLGDDGSRIWARPYGALSGSAAPIGPVATNTFNSRPMAAFAPSGAVVALWDEQGVGERNRDLFTARYTAGGASPWSAPVQLDSGEESFAGHHLAIGADGAAIVLWSEGVAGGGDFFTLFGREYR